MILPEVVRTPHGPMAGSASAGLLRELLEEFEREARSAGAPTDLWLDDGIGASEVISELADVGLIANDELITWFGWHNGIRDAATAGAGSRVLPFIIPASLDAAIHRYRDLVLDFVIPPNGSIGGNPTDMRGAGFGWLNLEADNYGLAVACRSEARFTPLVRRIEDDWDDPAARGKLQVVSLCTLVTWWTQGIRNGAVVWESESHLWSEPDTAKLPLLQVDTWFV